MQYQQQQQQNQSPQQVPALSGQRQPQRVGVRLYDMPSKSTVDESTNGLAVSTDPFDFTTEMDLTEEDPTAKAPFQDGDTFLDYNAYGSLRPGTLPSSYFRGECLAVMACAFIAGALYIWALYPAKQMIVQYFSDYQKPRKSWVNLLMPWSSVPSIFIGLLSDCVPIFRYRRKSYIAVCYLMSFFASVAMAVVFYQCEPKEKLTGTLYLIFIWIMQMFLQGAWVVLLSASVELAQRETLHERGHFQTLMFIVYFAGQSVMQLIVSLTLWPSYDGTLYTAALSNGGIYFVNGLLCLASIPVLYFYWQEDEVPLGSPLQMLGKRIRELWRLLAQKAVYQLVVALLVMIVFGIANNSNVNSVARFTSGYIGANLMWLNMTAYPARCMSAWMWKRFFINANWRLLACGGFIFLGAFKGTTTIMLINNILRGKTLYCIMSWFTQIPQGWLLMFQVIPTTEIIYMGREGTIIGFIQTVAALIQVGSNAWWSFVQKTVNLDVKTAEIKADTQHMRTNATIAASLVFGYTTLCILMVFFMPSQKLNAQQLRAFGGYHKFPRALLAIALVALLCEDLYNNISKLLL